MNNKILIVSANYYKDISKNLELGAINTLKEYGYEYEIINAPGCFEIPYLIKKNRKGSFIHFKIKGDGKVIKQLEKNEAIDKKLLRNLTVRVKKFDLENNYFTKKEDLETLETKEKSKN